MRDRYVIRERLGTGGKGAVFKALDRYRSTLPESQQYVALKILHCGDECSEQNIDDLRRELHCGQSLSHRNIVNVFELDRDGDVVFFTMELLQGELLGDLIERMRPAAMQRSQAWQIIRQLCAGLAHAHERGIVHGDLKPRNILVTREGVLRILDFGAARKIVLASAPAAETNSAAVSGTPAYASCELLEGRAADPRDDLYALACICYELLSGAHPFAYRPATLVRNFGVKAVRPPGLSGRQWSTLQTGLSWHRAGRSMSVHTWMQRLTHDIGDAPTLTPLQELKAADAAKPLLWLRSTAAVIAMIAIGAIGVAEIRSTSLSNIPQSAAPTPAPPGTVQSQTLELAPAPEPSPPPDNLTLDAAATKSAADDSTQAKPSGPSPLKISVDGYHISAGDTFVEIRVRRNQLQKNSSFAWWTESATAKQDVDYVHQAKAILTFPADRLSTRFYVKLLPESARSQRDYFYVAIAQPGRDPSSDKITRARIWLPMPREQLQARH